jgi:putative ABC transport system permease protein
MANPNPTPSPPRFSSFILERCTHGIERDFVLGDLEESFHRHCESAGPKAARRWYRRQALLALPGLVTSSTQWSLIMLGNYIKLTFRNLRRQKSHGVINILGLAVGLASCLLITLYISNELNYDNFHERSNQLFRVNWDFSWDQREGIGPGTPPPLAARLVQDFPEVTATTRVHPVSPMVVRHEDKFFMEDRIRAVDPNFLELFSFEVIEGDPATMLAEPQAVVLTKSAAQRYFAGRSSVIGRPLTIGQASEFLGRPYSADFTVTGIVKDPPANSHIQFDLLTSMSSHPQVAFFDWSWIWMQVTTYGTVTPDASIPDLEAKIVDMVATHAPDAFTRVGFSFDEMIEAGGRWNFVFQPVRDIYLGSADIGNRLGPLGNRDYLTVFGIVAAFVLLIACINFMNLSTARASTRAKEIGVRKTLGSRRNELVHQFMTESMVYAGIATVLAVGIAAALLGPFGQLAGRVYQFSDISYLGGPLWITLPALLIAVAAVVGLLAGSYPSLYLSSFHPIETLKGRFQGGKSSTRLRNGLVVFQFAISIALVCCTLVIQSQIRFFGKSDLGFTRENVIVISNHNHVLGDQLSTYRDLAAGLPGVSAASTTSGAPPYWGFQDYYRAEGQTNEQFDLISYQVDDHFQDALGIEIIEGRGFSEAFPSDSAAVILNESAVARLGWDDPIGRTIEYPSTMTYTVIGVMKDFNFLSQHQAISPFALFHETSRSYQIPDSYIVAQLSPDATQESIAALEENWVQLAPGVPFEYSFLDDNFADQYAAEQRLGSLFWIFAGLAMLVACLGLFGLASFTVERRTKEIGVRRTMGASVPSVVTLLSRDFARFVILANVVAWPVAWLVMSRWLDGFAYQVDLGFGLFLAAGVAALVIALLTVGRQTIVAALSDPVKALRYE